MYRYMNDGGVGKLRRLGSAGSVMEALQSLSMQIGASTCNRNKNAWEYIHDHRVMYMYLTYELHHIICIRE